MNKNSEKLREYKCERINGIHAMNRWKQITKIRQVHADISPSYKVCYRENWWITSSKSILKQNIAIVWWMCVDVCRES